MELTVGFFKNSLELALDSVRCRRNLSKVGLGFGLRPRGTCLLDSDSRALGTRPSQGQSDSYQELPKFRSNCGRDLGEERCHATTVAETYFTVKEIMGLVQRSLVWNSGRIIR